MSGSDGLGFVSAPLTHDLVVVGPASLDLWVKSTAADTDLQATVSEVRPDGKELFVQTGELRASDRALDASASTATHPVPTYRRVHRRTAAEAARTRWSESRSFPSGTRSAPDRGSG